MGQIFDKTHDLMNNWRWDNPCSFGDQINYSNPQTTSVRKDIRTSERLSLYDCDDRSAKIELPTCRQYKPGDFLAIRPLHWDEIIEKNEDDENWVDRKIPSGGRSCPGDGNDNHDGDCEEDTQRGEKGTGKGKGTMEGKGKGKVTKDGKGKGKGNGRATAEGKGKGKGNSKRKDIVKQTPGGDDISRAIALQMRNEMYEADSDMDG
jgi:hypothetical protein